MNRKAHQSGFSTVVGVVVLAVIVVLAVTGVVVYHHYKNMSTQNVVNIPELGIQITVPDDIKDLTYQVRTVMLRNGKQATLASFTTKTLMHIDPTCSGSSGPMGSLSRASGQYPTQSQDETPNDIAHYYGQLVKQYSTFYVTAISPQVACSTDAANAAVVKFGREFETAQSSIQQLN